MLLTYRECLSAYGSAYAIGKAVASGKLHKLEKGIYSDREVYVPEEAIIRTKYPNAVITLQSAFMYHGLSDTVPEQYALATGPKDAAISDPRIRQYYMPEGTLSVGKMEMEYGGAKIIVYDLERMLIELMRFRTKLSFDYYKEIVKNYRSNIDRLYPAKIDDYLAAFPKREAIESAIDKEVF